MVRQLDGLSSSTSSSSSFSVSTRQRRFNLNNNNNNNNNNHHNHSTVLDDKNKTEMIKKVDTTTTTTTSRLLSSLSSSSSKVRILSTDSSRTTTAAQQQQQDDHHHSQSIVTFDTIHTTTGSCTSCTERRDDDATTTTITNSSNEHSILSNRRFKRHSKRTTGSTTDSNKKYQFHHHNHHHRGRNSIRNNNNNDNNDDWNSFVRLFLRVGCVVSFIICTLYQTTYRRTLVFYNIQQQSTNNDDDDDIERDVTTTTAIGIANINKPYHGQPLFTLNDHITHDGSSLSTLNKLPTAAKWNVSSSPPAIQYDAYAIAELYQQQQQRQKKQQQASTTKTTTTTTTTTTPPLDRRGSNDNNDNNNNNDLKLFWQTANGLRQQFAELYGGINSVRLLLDRAISTFSNKDGTSHYDHTTNSNNNSNKIVPPTNTTYKLPDDLYVTACRIWSSKDPSTNHHHHNNIINDDESRTNNQQQQQQKKKNIFRFAFGGYSVTVGRGNLFSQSYPFVMEQQLRTVFALLGIQLQVRNAAIGGCPSLPYGFCTPNFWGEIPDVVSWDYSMNEAGGDPIGLEVYLRHIMKQYPTKQPKVIVKDTHLAYQRRNLLQYYYNQSQIHPSMSRTVRDPIVIHTEPAVEPFLAGIGTESDRPIGFQAWRKFGTPPNAPGQSSHHPAVKEHEFIAWILTMHFLSALEVVALAEGMDDYEEAHQFLYSHCPIIDDTDSLPEPMYEKAKHSTYLWNSILFGEPSGPGGQNWRMNDVQCRTSFEPIVSGDLSDVVVSGGIGEDLDVMLPKSKMFYNSGWVLDLGDDEKKAKRNLNRLEGHGFIDSKKAYYGIFASGSLQFFLPFESTNENVKQPSVGEAANRWFKSIVTCEVNEKRRSTTCNSVLDINYVIGGMNATQVSNIDTPATSYYGKKICTHILVPDNSTLTSISEMKASNNFDMKRSNIQQRTTRQSTDQVGLLLTLTVSNSRINRRDEACSVSHVIWEQLQTAA